MTSVGDGLSAPPGGWTFGGDAALTFDQHVARSIPWYEAGHDLIVDCADVLLGPGALVYEIGCSTGALVEKLDRRIGARGAQTIGIDREPDMVRQAVARCADLEQVRVVEANATAFVLAPCDLVISYYTMHFVRRDERADLVRRIHAALRPGGAFIMFDKVLSTGGRTQQLWSEVQDEWKRAQGYNDEEIAAKTRSLRGVLQPMSTAENVAMLNDAGFDDVSSIFKWLCWEGFLAVK